MCKLKMGFIHYKCIKCRRISLLTIPYMNSKREVVELTEL